MDVTILKLLKFQNLNTHTQRKDSKFTVTKHSFNEFTLYQKSHFWTKPNSKHLQTTNQMLLKRSLLSLIEEKILWEKKKMLVTSIFSIFYNAFKRLLSQGHYKSRLCGKELTQF